MGNDIFLQMFDHPDYVKAVIGFCASVGQKVAQAYLDNGADVIAVVDPMTSQISPEHFEQFVTPGGQPDLRLRPRPQGALLAVRLRGRHPQPRGHVPDRLRQHLASTRTSRWSGSATSPAAANKSFGGNLKLTSVLLLGDEEDAQLDAIRCIDVGGGCGFVLAPGCDLPFDTPEKNLAAVATMVHDSYHREVAKRTIIAKTAEHAGRSAAAGLRRASRT